MTQPTDIPAPRPTALRCLPLGTVRPAGWLAGQLRLMADGMAGHLDDVWPDVGDSGWVGGSADAWERGPYWLDGVVPLAHLLDDAGLRAKVDHWIGYILDHRGDDGWLGPRDGDAWPRMIVLKALLQQHEATGDERIVAAAAAQCRSLQSFLAERPLRSWGRFRWAELAWIAQQLYDRTGDVASVALAETARTQGYPWDRFAERLPYPAKLDREHLHGFHDRPGGPLAHDEFLASHGVNVAMGLKALPVQWRQRAGAERELFDSMLAHLDTHHGQATGLFSADEHLAGRHPSQGTETCAVVELLLSLAVAIETWGPIEAIIDRWERVAYNALPAFASADERAHQYDQQANQVICHVTEDRPYTNNGPDANTFGLEPNFGCCTANRHQGWPKFAARQWMATPDGGLLGLSYAPCDIDVERAGVPVRISVRGDYPFGDAITIEVCVERPVAFPLRLRVPGWAREARLAGSGLDLEGMAGEFVEVEAGTVHTIDRTWEGTTTLRLALPAAIETEWRYAGAVTIRRGPLVFALAVPETWQQRIGGDDVFPHWEVHPDRPWNYALELDPDDPAGTLRLERRTVAERPYGPAGAPLVVHGRGHRVPAWGLVNGAAAAPPPSPLRTAGSDLVDRNAEPVQLLPYGAARLRVTELPWVHPDD